MALPGFVLDDQKFFPAMLTFRGGQQDRTTRPKVSRWLIAVRTLQAMDVEIDGDIRHNKSLHLRGVAMVTSHALDKILVRSSALVGPMGDE